MAKFKIAQGKKDDIASAIITGELTPGTLIMTDDSAEIYYIDTTGELIEYTMKSRFSSLADATAWVSKYDCRGEIISVCNATSQNAYIVKNDNTLALISGGGGGGDVPQEEFFFEYAQTSIHPNKNYNYNTKNIEQTGNQYCCVYYEFDGEKKIRISCANSGASPKVAYTFVDENGNVIEKADFVANQTFENLILDVPEDSFAIYVNGNGYQSPHLEVATEGARADRKNEQYLLETFGRRISYKDSFAWKDMPNGLLAFSFDDSLDATNSIVDLFISKEVPCCFGAVHEKLNMGLENGETIAQAMQRGIDEVGCEVLAHGNSSEIITEDNVDDKDYLYEKFVVNMQKFYDSGFNVRGCLRVGGSLDGKPNLCNDPRTDVWVKMVYDYCDLYGVEEPYNHPRVSAGNSFETDKANIDACATNKNFTVLLFHQPPDYLSDLIDYAKNKGLTICNYAYAYDNFGTTVQNKDTIDRIAAIEEAYGDEVMY